MGLDAGKADAVLPCRDIIGRHDAGGPLLRVPMVGELRIGLGMPNEDVDVGSPSRLVDPFALARPVPV